MPKAAKLRKSPEMLAIERDKLDGECLVVWLCAKRDSGMTHQAIINELNALPGEDVKKSRINRWIDEFLDRRYFIRDRYTIRGSYVTLRA